MQGTIKSILNAVVGIAVVAIAVVLWLLNIFDIVLPIPSQNSADRKSPLRTVQASARL
jgi:hypothetical protein